MRRFARLLLVTTAALGATGPSLGAEQPVRWAFTSYRPANYVEGTGYAGFFYDIVIEAVEKRLGLPVEIGVFPWTRCQRLVELGQYDMLVTIPTEERLRYVSATDEPIWVKRRILYTYADHPDIAAIDALKGLDDIRDAGYTVVTYTGNGWIAGTVEPAGIPVLYASTVESMYRMLAAGRADLMIEERTIAEESIREEGVGAEVVATDGYGEESGFHILIAKASPHHAVLDELNAVLRDMTVDGTLAAILESYGMEAP